MKTNLYVLSGILTASISAVLADTLPSVSSPSVPTLSPGGHGFRNSNLTTLHPSTRPDDRGFANTDIGVFQGVDILANAPTSAGVRTRTTSKGYIPPLAGPLYSVFSEYNYIKSNDVRAVAGDTQTHSVTLGGSALFHGDTFLGLNYSYSNGAAKPNNVGTSAQTDAHFVTLVAAKSFWRFMSVGVAGTYGHTDIDLNATAGGGKSHAFSDTWGVSPFLSASYKSGPVVTSLTTMYQYQNDELHNNGTTSNDTGKFTVALRPTWSITERLKLQASAKYNQIIQGLNDTPGLPEGRHWATFGGRLSFNPSKSLELYAGYTYDAFNVFLEDHTVTGGLRYSF